MAAAAGCMSSFKPGPSHFLSFKDTTQLAVLHLATKNPRPPRVQAQNEVCWEH